MSKNILKIDGFYAEIIVSGSRSVSSPDASDDMLCIDNERYAIERKALRSNSHMGTYAASMTLSISAHATLLAIPRIYEQINLTKRMAFVAVDEVPGLTVETTIINDITRIGVFLTVKCSRSVPVQPGTIKGCITGDAAKMIEGNFTHTFLPMTESSNIMVALDPATQLSLPARLLSCKQCFVHEL